MSSNRETALREQLAAVVADLGYPPRNIDLRRVPFSGSWGAATSVAKALSGQVAADQIAAETAGLDKKVARERAAQIANAKAQEIAEQIAARLLAIGAADRVEAVNGFVNIYFDTAAVHHHAKAQTNLGIMYYNGQGVKKDPARAAHWFEQAAQQGAKKRGQVSGYGVQHYMVSANNSRPMSIRRISLVPAPIS